MNLLFTNRLMRKLCIKNKLILSLVPFILVTYLIILYMVYSVSRQETYHTVKRLADANLKQKIQIIDSQIIKIRSEMEAYMFNEDVQRQLRIQCSQMTTDERSALEKMVIRDMHKIIINYNRYVESICVKNSYGEYYLWKPDTRITSQAFIHNITMKEEEARRRNGEILFSYERLDQGVVTVTRRIIDPLLQEEIGFIMLDFSLDFLHSVEERSQSEPSRVSMLLFSERGEVIANPSWITDETIRKIRDGADRVSEQGSRYAAIREPSYSSDWVIVGLINESALSRNIDRIALIQFGSILLSIIMIISIIYYVAGGISKQFMVFMTKISLTGNGRTQDLIEVDSEDEFKELATVYNEMMGRINNLISTVYAKEVLLKLSELKAFQAQINPHFLYNTLDCVNSLVDAGKTTETKKTVSALASIMRMCIKGDELITIGENLKYIRQYIYIEKTRYAGKILFLIEVPERLNDYLMPKLIFQPILENSVNHGVSGMLERGMIALYGKEEDEELVFQIKDNGIGFSEDVILRINHYDVASEDSGSTKDSIGLMNIQARIQLTYGSGYGITVENRPAGGACVTIRIPKIRKEDMM